MKITTKAGEEIFFEIAEIHKEIHSCTISVNARGEFYGEVKAYGASPISAVEDAKVAMGLLKEFLDQQNNTHRLK
jgi:hypothetical protein